jgi:hypothetical protein
MKLELAIATLISFYALTCTLMLGFWVDESYTHYTPMGPAVGAAFVALVPVSLLSGPAWRSYRRRWRRSSDGPPTSDWRTSKP